MTQDQYYAQFRGDDDPMPPGLQIILDVVSNKELSTGALGAVYVYLRGYNAGYSGRASEPLGAGIPTIENVYLTGYKYGRADAGRLVL